MNIFAIVLKLLTVLFLAGNTLLLILIIISGSTTDFPIDRFFWVEADTSSIPNAYAGTTRWTFWGACEYDGSDVRCDDLSPAYPISPYDNFHTTELPAKFIHDRDTFYYLSRFSFCFFWISLAFIGISFLISLLGVIWSRYLRLTIILTLVGGLFNTTAVVLQTAVSVIARNTFHDAQISSKLGPDLFGIAWASVAVSIIESAIISITVYIDNKSTHTSTYNNLYKTTPLESASYNDPINEPQFQQLHQQQPQHLEPPQRKGINFFTIRNTKTEIDSV